MSDDFATVFTRAGLAAVRAADSAGLQASIAALAIGQGGPNGSGGFVGYTPNGTETALRGEVSRQPLLSGVPFGGAAETGALGFTVTSLFPRLAAGAPPARVREVGVFLSDGTLLCVWSDPADTNALAELTSVGALVLSLDLYLTALPSAAITVTVQDLGPPDNLACLAQLLRGVARNTTRALLSTYNLARRGIRS